MTETQKPHNPYVEYELWEMKIRRKSATEYTAEKRELIKVVNLLPHQAAEYNIHTMNSGKQVFEVTKNEE